MRDCPAAEYRLEDEARDRNLRAWLSSQTSEFSHRIRAQSAREPDKKLDIISKKCARVLLAT